MWPDFVVCGTLIIIAESYKGGRYDKLQQPVIMKPVKKSGK